MLILSRQAHLSVRCSYSLSRRQAHLSVRGSLKMLLQIIDELNNPSINQLKKLYYIHELLTITQPLSSSGSTVTWRPCYSARDSRQAASTASHRYVSIRQHTSAYVSIRQHTSACVSIHQHASAYVSIRQHTSACVSIRQHTSACVSIRQHTSAYVSDRRRVLRGPRFACGFLALLVQKCKY
jgi:hypothetical protein